ncbi:MAG TPA: TetR/AcrR family transcriptional regulator [Acidimicrobiales bacterium]
MARRYSMEGRNAAVEANRRAVLDAALDVLGTAGADGFTMQAVATRAGVSLRSVYNYFETREQLLAAVFGALVEVTRHAIEIRVPRAPEPRARLQEFAAVHFDVLERQRRHMAVLLAVRGVAELDERVRAIRAWRHGVLRQLLADCGLRGATLDRAAAAAFLLTTFSSYTALTGDLGLDHAGAIRVVAQALAGLAAPAGG